jgi:hypothetical protein
VKTAVILTFAAVILSALVFTKGWQASVASAAACAVLLPAGWYADRRRSLVPPRVASVLAAMEDRS